MELPNRITQNGHTVRVVSALALAALAVRSFINGNRLRGILAAGGAVAVGATASTLEPTELDIDQVVASAESTDTGGLQCSVCDDQIVPGQPRRPTDTNDIVHETCL